MLGLLLALIILALAAGLTYYLLHVRMSQMASGFGAAHLASMKWRDYINLVLEVLHRRGWNRGLDCDEDGDGNFLLTRGDEKRLLSSKHGTAYVLGSTAIAEFANLTRKHNASGGWLVTSGAFAPEAAPLAAVQKLELLDGPTLWPEIAPLLPPETRATIDAAPRKIVQKQLYILWPIALILAGVSIFMLRSPDTESEDLSQTQVLHSPIAKKTPAQAAAAADNEAERQVPTDPAALTQRRTELASTISTLDFVDRAAWPIESTLVVYLAGEAPADAKQRLCPLVEKYHELRTSRIQLQPPVGSTAQVRFLQCKMM